MGSSQGKSNPTPYDKTSWVTRPSCLWPVVVLAFILAVGALTRSVTASADNAVWLGFEQAGPAAGRPTPGVAAEASPQPPVALPAPQAGCPPQSASAPADWPLLLCDTFVDNTNSWQVGEDNRSAGDIKRIVANGLYTYDVEAREGLMDWSTSSLAPLGDFYAAVDAYVAEGALDSVQYGLRFRVEGFNQAYTFLVSGTKGFMLIRNVGELSVPIGWTPTEAIHPNDWNRVALRAVGQQLTFYVNEQQVAEFRDEVALAGQMALAVRVAEPGHAVLQFDNFEVRSPETVGAPTPTPTPVPNPPPETTVALAPTPIPTLASSPTPETAMTPAPTAVPSPSAQAPRAGCPPQSAHAPVDWPLLLCDTFDDNVNGWDEGVMNRDEGRIARTVADGVYSWEMEVDKFFYVGGSAPSGELIDLYAAVDVRVVDSPQTSLWYGLEVRRQGVLAFYMFRVSNDGKFSLWRWVGDSTYPIDWTSSQALRLNDWNRIAVKAAGPQLTFYINDQQVGEFADNVIMAGRVQLVFALQTAGHAAVQFDNFEIRAAPYAGVPTFAPPPTLGPTPTPTDTPLPPTPPPPPKASAAGCPPSSAAAPADWPLVICDTFDDDINQWGVVPACDEFACNTRAIVNGVFAWNIEAYKSHQTQFPVPLDPVSDFYAAVDVYIVEESAGDVEYGLMFRKPDWNNGYSLQIGSHNLVGVYRLLDGESTNVLISEIPDGILRPGEWNRLAVMGVGPSIVLYVNDQEVGRLSDPFVPAGQFMLLAVILKPGHFVVYFDNFEVRQAPPDAKPPPTPRKVITSCPNSPAAAPADWPILACDTFEDNSYGWRVGPDTLPSGGNKLQRIEDGVFRWAFSSPESVYSGDDPVSLEPLSDFFVSLQARRVSLVEQTGYGLIFRMKDYNNLFWFTVNDKQQYEVLIEVDGFRRAPIEPTKSPAIRVNETNTLAVRSEGRHFTFYINDEMVAEMDDIHFREGKLGLMAVIERGDEGRIEFDNFEVRVPPK